MQLQNEYELLSRVVTGTRLGPSTRHTRPIFWYLVPGGVNNTLNKYPALKKLTSKIIYLIIVDIMVLLWLKFMPHGRWINHSNIRYFMIGDCQIYQLLFFSITCYSCYLSVISYMLRSMKLWVMIKYFFNSE